MMTTTATKVIATVDVEALAKALGRISHVSTTKSSLDVLACTLLEITPDALRLSTTDLTCWARVAVLCEADGDARVALPTSIFAGIVRSLRKGTVHIEVADCQAKLVAGGTYRIQGVDPFNFPIWPQVEGAEWTLTAEQVKRALGFVGWCRSDQVSRPIMNGVWLDTPKGRAIATSGHVLGSISLGEPSKGGKAPIIPEPALSGLLKLLGTGEVVLCSDENRLRADHEGIEFVTALVEGTFPNVDQVIPRDNTFHAEVNRADLIAATERAQVYVGRDDSQRLTLEWRKDTLTVSSLNPDRGEQNETIWTDANGELRINFSTTYLLTALKNLQGDRVRVEAKAPERAAVWRGSEPDAFYLIMPMRDLR